MKNEKLESTVIKAKANWRKVCARPGSTTDDRRNAFAVWKKAEIARNKAKLIWRNALANRRKAMADRRKAHPGTGSLQENANRRKAPRRP